MLKRDGFGRVELVLGPCGRAVRRVACGGSVPGSRLVARMLLARERRALQALAGLEGVPRLEDELGGSKDVLVRRYLEGKPLHEAERLPRDFFDRLRELVVAVHERGVCHNDLHKEQNVLVGEGGRPALVDFQLASVHARAGAIFRSRCREDLRHVEKHRRRYERRGRPAEPSARRNEVRPRRSAVAWLWLVFGKPVYNLLAGVLGARDAEPRRSSAGPWPEWTEPSDSRRNESRGPGSCSSDADRAAAQSRGAEPHSTLAISHQVASETPQMPAPAAVQPAAGERCG